MFSIIRVSGCNIHYYKWPYSSKTASVAPFKFFQRILYLDSLTPYINTYSSEIPWPTICSDALASLDACSTVLFTYHRSLVHPHPYYSFLFYDFVIITIYYLHPRRQLQTPSSTSLPPLFIAFNLTHTVYGPSWDPLHCLHPYMYLQPLFSSIAL